MDDVLDVWPLGGRILADHGLGNVHGHSIELSANGEPGVLHNVSRAHHSFGEVVRVLKRVLVPREALVDMINEESVGDEPVTVGAL